MSCGRMIMPDLNDNPLSQHIKGLQDEIAHLNTMVALLEADKAELARDEARLDWLEFQTKASPQTGTSFDWCKHVEDGRVLEHGYRFMRRFFLGERKPSIREAIDSAMQSSQGWAREGGKV